MGSQRDEPEAGQSHPPAAGDDGKKNDGEFFAVGVGASAGGLEALTELLERLPQATGMAFILVQHLDPHHESILTELLSAKTRLPVVQVHNETRIEIDHVYVIPPNTVMLVRDRTLVLEARPATAERYRPIDACFRSLAQEFRFHAVGVVLSGTASDGTLGLKAIKAEGGITFAQDHTARFDSMPRNAIAAGAVDFVLPPQRIAEELVALARRNTGLYRAEDEPAGNRMTFQRVLLLLRNQTGVDFSMYKQPTVLRRLQRRIVVRQSGSIEQYFELLQKDSDELQSLFDDLLINVTDFFRDPEVYEACKQVALPALIRNRKEPVTVRGWIPGCSTGEEVYSMAITLVEFLESEDVVYTIQLFGTDVSDKAIEKARSGIYDQSAVANVSPERLRRFFLRTESGYQISRAIREMCIFSRHNLAKDPPLSRMDLISCRNLLIYFAAPLQRSIIATFGYALRSGGCLILGTSETLGALADFFVTVDEPHKIYSRKAALPQGVFQLLETSDVIRVLSPPAPALLSPAQTPAAGLRTSPRFLPRYDPAGVVVNEALKVTDYRGDTTPYLIGPDTPPDADLMTLVRPELRDALGRSIEQATHTNVAVVAESPRHGGAWPVIITVVPFKTNGIATHLLVLFGDSRVEVPRPPLEVPGAAHEETEPKAAPASDQENSELRRDLRSTREYLQAVIEELRATNEEAQSANEELQSTNEEVQTAKEELQASNEELNTINAEMQSRNLELARTNDDLINLLSSMSTPIVMTGGDLRIRRFTPTAERVLRLIFSDIGRPIADLKPRINVPNLEEILQRVVDTLQPHEQEVQDQEGRQYLMRVRPYRTADSRIDGSVLQLLDVTDLKRTLEVARYARDYAEAIVNTVREPLIVLDQQLIIQNANRAFYDDISLTPPAAYGRSIYEVAGGRFDLPEIRGLLSPANSQFPQSSEVEVRSQSDRGEVRVLSWNARRLQTPDQKQLILLSFEDITDRKRAAEARYRQLFESARDVIILADAANGEILDVNPFTEKLLGYSRSELVGRKFWECAPMGNLQRVRAIFEQIRDQGVLRFSEMPLRTRDGQELQAEVIANIYADGDRRAIQFNIRDVSERKKFERELQATQKLESLGLLAGGIAHDFNNLLTGIIGNASLVLSELPADMPLRGRIRDVVRAGERAAFLTRQMLAYAGKSNFIGESIDLSDLVSEISALVSTSISKSVELKPDLAPNPPPIEGDVSQIQQVIMNLVINGAESIGENTAGRVDIRTSVRELDAGEAAEFFGAERNAAGTYVQLEVCDTGSGMDDATRARIFDPFFTTKFTGRGLGLAAVQGIVKAHSGAIRLHSSPGQGTSFLILLPARAQKAAVTDPPAAKTSGSIPPGSTVLVIDDEEQIRSLIGRVLSRAGMNVLFAENGKAGVDIFRERQASISVVLLDLLMPVMGGEETLVLLKQINPQVPVVLSSGFDESEVARRFSGPKPTSFLQKPYTAQRLAEAVAAALNQTKA